MGERRFYMPPPLFEVVPCKTVTLRSSPNHQPLGLNMQMRPLVATVLLAATAGASQAALTLYTSEAAYLAAVGATLDYQDFNPSPSPPAVVSGTSFGSVLSFASCITTTSTAAANCNFNVLHSSNAITDLGGSASPNGVASLLADVLLPAFDLFTGVAFNFVSGGIASVMLFDEFGNSTGSVDTSSASGFIGLVSDVPLNRLTLIAANAVFPNNIGNDRYFFDDFRVNSAATVPEPASYGLVALGVVGVALSRRRRVS